MFVSVAKPVLGKAHINLQKMEILVKGQICKCTEQNVGDKRQVNVTLAP